MNKNCLKCGKEYALHAFSLDSGYCDGCKPGFFDPPEFRESTPKESKLLFVSMICINIFLVFLSPFLLNVIAGFGILFFGIMTIFWLYEFIRYCFSRKGFPELTICQRLMILLSPFYGFLAFMIIWRLIRAFIFKESFS